jgi:2-amino-4-hydroxy-6-hydroxymethyldihydropteridine diphosphokinase
MGLFVVSLGSNIQPAGNLACAVRFLLSLAKTVHLSRVVETESVGVDGGGRFLNLAVAFEVGLDEAALKREMVGYEEVFGRDRGDPARKHKPRPLDLDILFELETGETTIPAERIPAEPYARPVVLELLDYLGLRCPIAVPAMSRGVEIDVGNLWVGAEPATLTLDPASGGPVRADRRLRGSD